MNNPSMMPMPAEGAEPMPEAAAEMPMFHSTEPGLTSGVQVGDEIEVKAMLRVADVSEDGGADFEVVSADRSGAEPNRPEPGMNTKGAMDSYFAGKE